MTCHGADGDRDWPEHLASIDKERCERLRPDEGEDRHQQDATARQALASCFILKCAYRHACDIHVCASYRLCHYMPDEL